MSNALPKVGFVLAVIVKICWTLSASAATPLVVETIAPRQADVATINGIVKAFYDVVSGPAGQPRQWARDRTLYIEGVRFVIIERKDGKPRPRILSHQQYVDSTNGSFEKQGLFEHEMHRVVRRFGDIAHVFSTYELRSQPEGQAFARGVNSIELFFDGKRWWIASALWQNEGPDAPIPEELLPRNP